MRLPRHAGFSHRAAKSQPLWPTQLILSDLAEPQARCRDVPTLSIKALLVCGKNLVLGLDRGEGFRNLRLVRESECPDHLTLTNSCGGNEQLARRPFTNLEHLRFRPLLNLN
jgi:hypothetical protein